MAYTVTEILWIHYLLAELGILITAPVKVLYDSISTTYIAANPLLYGHNNISKLAIILFANVYPMVILLVARSPLNFSLRIFLQTLFQQLNFVY